MTDIAAIRARHDGPHDCSGHTDGGYRVAPFAYGCDTAVVLAALDKHLTSFVGWEATLRVTESHLTAAIEREARLRAAAEAVRDTLTVVPPNAGRIGFLVAPGQGRAFELAAADLVAALATTPQSAPVEPTAEGD